MMLYQFNLTENYKKEVKQKKQKFEKNSSKFINKKQYQNNFIQLLDKSNYVKNLVINYNQSSWSDINKVKECVGKFKKNIKVIDIAYAYKQRKVRTGTEYLIIAN